MELRNTHGVLLDYLKLTDTKIKFLKKKFAQLNKYSDTLTDPSNLRKKVVARLVGPFGFADDGVFTARKRSLGQGNIFTPVCHSVHRGGST